MTATEVNNLDMEQILQSVEASAIVLFSTLDKPKAPDQSTSWSSTTIAVKPGS